MYDEKTGFHTVNVLVMVPTESHSRVMPTYALVPSAPSDCFILQTDPRLIDDTYMRAYALFKAAILMESKQADILGELGKTLKSRTRDLEMDKVYRKNPTAMLPFRAKSWQQQGSTIPNNYILAVIEALTTLHAIVQMVEGAINLSSETETSPLRPCRKYQQTFVIDGKALSTTNLTVFEREFLEVNKPSSMPPRPLSQVKREKVVKIVIDGNAEGIMKTINWCGLLRLS